MGEAGWNYDLGVLFVHGLGNQTLGSTLTGFGTPLVGVPMAFISGALSSQKYLTPRLGSGPSWAVASILMLVGALLSVAAIRGLLEALGEKDEKTGNGPPA